MLRPVDYAGSKAIFNFEVTPRPLKRKELVGADIFIQATGASAEGIAKAIQALGTDPLTLTMITNRGTKVWPEGFPETFCTDHWRCRFKSADNRPLDYQSVIDTMHKMSQAKLDIIKTENLYLFDGEPGFTAAQGQ